MEVQMGHGTQRLPLPAEVILDASQHKGAAKGRLALLQLGAR
jgi:hypothetical protein